MSVVVLGASTKISWTIRSQATSAAQAVPDDADITEFEVPHLFPSEIRNALLKLERRKLSDAEQTAQGLAMLGTLPIVVRPAPTPASYDALVRLARDLQLSFYDAHYLDLAIVGGHALVCRDLPLLAGARQRGVSVRSTLPEAP